MAATIEAVRFSDSPLGEMIPHILDGFSLHRGLSEHHQMHDLDLVRANPHFLHEGQITALTDEYMYAFVSQGASEAEKEYAERLRSARDQHEFLAAAASDGGFGYYAIHNRLPTVNETRTKLAEYRTEKPEVAKGLDIILEEMAYEIPEFESPLQVGRFSRMDERVDREDTESRLALILTVIA
jgi:hypothetical protein